MPIVKLAKKVNRFAQIDNRVLNDERLSWKARGLLAYLLSKPDTWKVWIKDLEKSSPSGRYAVRTAIKELMTHKYITREQLKQEDGTFGEIEYTVYEEPLCGFPLTDNPLTDNQTHSNTEVSNIQPNKVEDVATQQSSSRSPALQYCLKQFSRKRFSTKGQEDTLAALEREVGTDNFKWVVDWLANIGKLNANALCTAARKHAKEQRRVQVQRQRTPPTRAFVPKERTPWDDVLDHLRGQMTDADFAQMWEGTSAENTDDGIIVYAKTDRHRDWIENRLRRKLEQAVHLVWPGQPVTIKVKE